MIFKIIAVITTIYALYRLPSALVRLKKIFVVDWEREKKKFIRKHGGISPDGEERKLVGTITRRLVACSDRPDLKYTVDVLAASDLEACALDNHIFISRAWLRLLAGDSHLVAAILAHELVHVMARHGRVRSVYRKIMTAIELLLSFLRISPISSRLIHYAFKYSEADNSRDNEREADRKATRLLEKAGFRPRAMEELLERLAEAYESEGGGKPKENMIGNLKNTIERFFATHPELRDRIDELKKGRERAKRK